MSESSDLPPAPPPPLRAGPHRAWRQNNLLVLDRYVGQVDPGYCIYTGSPVGPDDMSKLKLGKAAHPPYAPLHPHRQIVEAYSMDIPVSRKGRRRRMLRKIPGWFFIGLAGLLLLDSFVLKPIIDFVRGDQAFRGRRIEHMTREEQQSAQQGMAMAKIALVGGIGVAFMSSAKLHRTSRVTGWYVYVKGASPEVLDHLPMFPGEHAASQAEYVYPTDPPPPQDP